MPQNPHPDPNLRDWIFNRMKRNRTMEHFFVEIQFRVNIIFVSDFSCRHMALPILMEQLVCLVRFSTVDVKVGPNTAAHFDVFVLGHQILEG